MGKIKVQGYAEKEVHYDLVTLTITFRAGEKTAARAAEEVLKKSNLFLEKLQHKGVNLEGVHLEDDSVRHAFNDKEQITFNAVRKVRITIPFHMNFLNSIMEQIQKHDGDIEYDTEFRLANPEILREELLKEAVLDAKRKAEAIAVASGQTVVSLKSAVPGHRGRGVMNRFLNFMNLSDEDECNYCDEPYVADKLQAPLTKENELVDTVWVIE